MGRQRGTPLIGRLDTRKEHYLPRFFLRRFVDDKGTLSVISRADEGGRPCLRPNMRVENVASVNGLYETAYPGDRNGTYYFPNYIEKSLSSMETFSSCCNKRVCVETTRDGIRLGSIRAIIFSRSWHRCS